MESYEKQQMRYLLHTLLLVALVFGLIIFLCFAEKDYERLALFVGLMIAIIFKGSRGIRGLILYYQGKPQE